MAEVTSQRQLGFWMCTALVIGNTIGMGIFVLPASLAPYGFNASIGWLITVVGCLLIALVFARLARMMPRANGPYDYIRYELGELPAFIPAFNRMGMTLPVQHDEDLADRGVDPCLAALG